MQKDHWQIDKYKHTKEHKDLSGKPSQEENPTKLPMYKMYLKYKTRP